MTTTHTTSTSEVPGAPEVIQVTDDDFAPEVLASPLPVLVEFTAEWCGPCRLMIPVLRDLAAEEHARLKVVRLDVDTSPRTALAHKVLSAPTFLLFRDGEPVWSAVGARSKRRLAQELAPLL
uniref:thioredoxin family protein n=1 Tax=Streptomyces corallincola TaxID=2851888 RepID=UPI001FE86687|nr:thioredoxin domain-containing protein [Streptomyces corallincola]